MSAEPPVTPPGDGPTLAQRFATRRERREWERAHPGKQLPDDAAPSASAPAGPASAGAEPSAAESPVPDPAAAGAEETVRSEPTPGSDAAASPLLPPSSRAVPSPAPAMTPRDTQPETESPSAPADEPAPEDDQSVSAALLGLSVTLDPAGTEPAGPAGSERTRRPRRLRGWIAGGISLVIVVALVVVALVFGRGVYQTLRQSDDYPGPGTGSVVFTVTEGDTGSTIGQRLVTDGVIKSYRPFLTAYNQHTPAPVFQPGAYRLKKHMTASGALDVLRDKTNIVSATVVIPEGFTLKQTLARIHARTGISEDALASAAANVHQFQVAPEATTLEGYLFPATYQFDPGTTAQQALTAMVTRARQALAQAGIASADEYRILTLASIVQKEAGSTADMPKVARVFQNRLDRGMNLQSDATVAYGAGTTGRVTTTDAERADANNQYNTYAHSGLPVGPISNPGDAALAAAASPVPGDWLYFVTVNLDTGETKFESNADDHAADVKEFQSWCRQHTDRCQ